MSLPNGLVNGQTTQMSTLLHSLAQAWRPPPRLTVSQWADQTRRLSPEASAEPGRWYTARAEYMRGVMDTVSDPTVRQVVVMSAAQVGKVVCTRELVEISQVI